MSCIPKVVQLVELVIVLGLSLTAGLAQSVTIEGRATGQYGETLPPSLKVILVDLVNKGVIRKADIVDADAGKFEIKFVGQGDYDVVACAGKNYIPRRRNIKVTDGKAPPADLTLEDATPQRTNLKVNVQIGNTEVSALAYQCEVAAMKALAPGWYTFDGLPVPPERYTAGVVTQTGKFLQSNPFVITVGGETEVALTFEGSAGSETGLIATVAPPVVTVDVNPIDLEQMIQHSIGIFGAGLSRLQTRVIIEGDSIGSSGTNDFHGTLSYKLVHDRLAARNFFNLQDFDTYRRHTGTVQLGGPIIKNRAFFFVNYDFMRGLEAPTYSPNLTSQLAALNQQLRRLGLTVEDLDSVLIAPASDLPSLRLDYKPHQYHSFWFGYDYKRNLVRNNFNNQSLLAEGTSTAPSAASDTLDRVHNIKLGYEGNPASGMNLTATYRYQNYKSSAEPVRPNAVSIVIPGLVVLGRSSNLSGDSYDRSTHDFSIASKLRRSNHTLRFGGEVEFNQNQFTWEAFESGRAIIPSLASLSLPVPSVDLFQYGRGGARVDFKTSRVNFYFRDEYRATPNLTVSFGLAEKIEVPPSFRRKEINGLQPNLAVSWDIMGARRAVLRLSYGLLREPLPELPIGFELLLGGNSSSLRPNTPVPVRHVTSFIGTQSASTAFSDFLMQSAPPGPAMAIVYDPNARSSVFQTASANLETSLPKISKLSLGYAFRRGNHQLTATNINLPPPALISNRPDFGNGTLNPAFAQIYEYQTVGNSSLHTGSLDFRFRPMKDIELNGNYVFSKLTDDFSADSFEATPENVFNRRNDRAISNLIPRHRLSVNAHWDLPNYWGRKRRVGQKPTRSEQVMGRPFFDGDFNFRSGYRFNVLAGFDANHDGNPLNDRPLGIGRNTFLGQRYARLDVRFGSIIRVSSSHEQMRFQWSVNFLNLLNRTNFRAFNTVLGRADLSGLDPNIVFGRAEVSDFDFRHPLGPNGFGQATSAFDPRRVELVFKFDF
jgi:hypothetical protein